MAQWFREGKSRWDSAAPSKYSFGWITELKPERTRGNFRLALGCVINCVVGVVLLLSAEYLPSRLWLLQAWFICIGLVMILHFGTFRILAWAWRQYGFDVEPIMRFPLAARRVSDFWGGRCNLAFKQLRSNGKLVALDFCPEMCRRAELRRASVAGISPEILQEDFLRNSIPDSSADCVVSAFGLKTFSNEQKVVAAHEIQRILRPGGKFSLLEISGPDSRVPRLPYMFYLKRVIPLLGRLFLGNPENYRLLGVYTEHFRNSRAMERLLDEAGLKVQYRTFFFGCATGLDGVKSLKAEARTLWRNALRRVEISSLLRRQW